MARSRMIKPEFWDDEKLAGISRDARLTFIGIWNNSDDFGVVKGHSLWLKSQIFPYDVLDLIQFDAFLSELAQINVIIPFEYSGEKYFYIPNFLKHQVINRPSKTRNPEYTGPIAEHSRSTHGALTDETETERERETETCSFDFEVVWRIYPKREGRKNAERHFRASVKSEKDYSDLKKAIMNYSDRIRRENTEMRFVKMGSTFFNNWRDYIPDETPASDETKLWSPQ